MTTETTDTPAVPLETQNTSPRPPRPAQSAAAARVGGGVGMFGSFTLTATFPIRDGGDARDAQRVLAAAWDAAMDAGALPKEATASGSCHARTAAEEQQRRARQARKEARHGR